MHLGLAYDITANVYVFVAKNLATNFRKIAAKCKK